MTARKTWLAAALAYAIVACAVQEGSDAELHRWWSGLGPVLPHDTFPSDCKLCHAGATGDVLTDDFRFDHLQETGVPLHGAHAQARCLRCHNDRGPIAVFQAKGCAGCHEDVHYGELGATCTTCHDERSWRPQGMVARHNLTRFPLTGAHALVACQRCHPGAFVGNFVPTDNECATCHLDDALATTNPPHAGLGWVNTCERCHSQTKWNHARLQ